MRKIKTYAPKGFSKFIFADGHEVLSKDYQQNELCVTFNTFYEMSRKGDGMFYQWSKTKGKLNVYSPVTRIYNY